MSKSNLTTIRSHGKVAGFVAGAKRHGVSQIFIAHTVGSPRWGGEKIKDYGRAAKELRVRQRFGIDLVKLRGKDLSEPSAIFGNDDRFVFSDMVRLEQARNSASNGN